MFSWEIHLTHEEVPSMTHEVGKEALYVTRARKNPKSRIGWGPFPRPIFIPWLDFPDLSLGGCWDMWYGWLHKCSNMCINLNPCRTGRIFRRFSILSNMCKIRKCPFTPCELDTCQNIYFRQHVLMGSYLLSHLSMWCFDQLVNILYPAECEGNPVISANTFEIWFEL